MKFAEVHLSNKPELKKLEAFIAWCNENDIEEVMIRLSPENKGGWGKNFFLNFTTKRLIVSKKSFVRKFADLGFIAGMAPFPYLVISKRLHNYRIKHQYVIDPEAILGGESSNFFIPYSDIHEIILRKGTESIISNMLGTMITTNFLIVKTQDETHNFTIPVNKNGTFENIYYWLRACLPIPILGA
jgi:hypothetical protein